jgi:hypothetical protein
MSAPDAVYNGSYATGFTINASVVTKFGLLPPAGTVLLFLLPQEAATIKNVAREQKQDANRTILVSGVRPRGHWAVKVSYRELRLRLHRAALIKLKYRRKFIWLGVLFLLVFFVQFVFPHYLNLGSAYNSYIFRPFQNLRNMVFGLLPFSLGDFVYLAGILVALATIIRWSYYLFRYRAYRHDLAHLSLNTVITLGIVYLLFFVGWGGNYYKPTLSKFWQLSPSEMPVKESIVAYDSLLISRLNALAPDYRGLNFSELNHRARKYYQTLTDSRTKLRGLKAKASIYGYFMQYLGVQGYYNPFTGEAQVNSALPQFMLPFVICHEMAHQTGIAAEDDANLLAYAICTIAPDSAFAYSGYFNLWLYAQSRLRELDSVKARSMIDQLNPISLSQLDTLRDIRRRYRSHVSTYSMALYDQYLRLHNQKDGINSYDNVALSAWAWELRRQKEEVELKIP